MNRSLRKYEGRQALLKEIELSQNKAALEQLRAQIEELYSPLYGLIRRSSETYKVALERLPSIKSGHPDEKEAPIWQHFVERHFLPSNAQIADLIQSKMHLVEDKELPESWKLFLQHQAQFDVLHNLWKEKNVHSIGRVKGVGWPALFGDEVGKTLGQLRSEYNKYARRLKLAPEVVSESRPWITTLPVSWLRNIRIR